MVNLRKKLEKRARQQIALSNGITPKELIKSPSQKKSERMKAKDRKRAGIKQVEPEPPSDCRGCEKQCQYNSDLNICPERSFVVRCKQCGQKVRIRIINGVGYELCPVCAARPRS